MDRKIIRTALPDGSEVVRVEIANQRGVFAVMDATDYDDWIAAGRDTRFILNRNGPMTGTYRVVFYDLSVAGGIAGVARQIVSPGRGKVIRYRDDDRLNLRRSNLDVQGGRARGQSTFVEGEGLVPRRLDANPSEYNATA